MNNDTICAISTNIGEAAIAIIRLTGSNSIKICNKIFKTKNKKKISIQDARKIIMGKIIENNKTIDEVLITIFKAPKSYTGENTVEISCHGSLFIQNKIIQLLIKNGCRLAKNGEFTLRAFLNRKLDLSQAEGVAELISSDNEKAHELAMKQMRGGFSNEIKILRKQFIKFASLIELELDFSQEDVEFANRKDLLDLINKINIKVNQLLDSFKLGNVIKNGIPISIVGAPNAGKSTLLNTILHEERAIVSNIKGTTRDTIEEKIIIKGFKMRFIDTAGLRETNDTIEKIGISKTYKKMTESAFILYLIDKTDLDIISIEKELERITDGMKNQSEIIILANKHDLNNQNLELADVNNIKIINISAKNGEGINQVLDVIIEKIESWQNINYDITMINQRHFESLINTLNSIKDIQNGFKKNISSEFISLDIKRCLDYLGEITGEITNENLLDSIFKDFCIGK